MLRKKAIIPHSARLSTAGCDLQEILMTYEKKYAAHRATFVFLRNTKKQEFSWLDLLHYALLTAKS